MTTAQPTHLPNFVLDLMRAVQQDYGITQPDMSYTSANSNEYDHETRWATPNANGVLPGRAYAHGGMAPEVLNAAGTRVITGGTCVSVGEVTGGMIGYRPMLATEYVSAAVFGWRNNVRQAGNVPEAAKSLVNDVYGSFFEPTSVTKLSGGFPRLSW